MQEHPILFSGEMVRAILDGRKTQTRRVVTRENSTINGYSPGRAGGLWDKLDFENGVPRQTNSMLDALCGIGAISNSPLDFHLDVPTMETDPGWRTRHRVRCRYEVDDRLWVREAFWPAFSRTDTSSGIVYRADYSETGKPHPHRLDLAPLSPGWKWKPSIFMPRWASRILLEVVSVRVERLQEITNGDARSEGMFARGAMNFFNGVNSYPFNYPRDAFADLWNTINKGCGFGWDKNPWVWVVEFKRLEA